MAYSPQSFAVAVLKRLGAPVNPANVRALVGWEKAEGGHWHNQARFNPLNTTQPAAGAGNTGSQGNIKVYRSPQQGVNATVQTLKNGRYANILAAFARSDPNAVARAIGQSPWGTSGALVAQTIGSTPAPGHIGGGISGGGGSTGGGTTTRTTTTGLTPDALSARRALLAQFVLDKRPDPVALAQAFAAQNQTQSTTKVRTTGGGATAAAPSSSTPQAAGVVKFDGKPVAAWIAPALAYARQHGWKGTVNSGYRSFADQQRIYNSGVRPAARPGTSNHEGSQFPRGAVDVSDAQTLSRILQGSKYAHLLVWAGGKDPVHFSHPHNGSY